MDLDKVAENRGFRVTGILTLRTHDSVMQPLLPLLLAGLLPIGIATAQEVRISERDCARLVEHVPEAGVAHVPNVDVRGRPVAPADLPGSPQIWIPDSFSIPITVDLAERLGIPPGGDADFTAEAFIGQVDVAPDGRAFFNGQPLQNEAARQLSLLCQTQGTVR